MVPSLLLLLRIVGVGCGVDVSICASACLKNDNEGYRFHGVCDGINTRSVTIKRLSFFSFLGIWTCLMLYRNLKVLESSASPCSESFQFHKNNRTGTRH